MAKVRSEPAAALSAAQLGGPAAATETLAAAAPEPKKPRPGQLPPPPGKKLSPAVFFDYISKFDEEHDWIHAVVYVYRQFPVLRKASGPDETNYIDKISRPFDAAYIEREHGSGTYSLTLNDLNTPGNQRTVCHIDKWVIRDADGSRPPVIPDLNRLSRSDPANKDYVSHLIRTGKLLPDGNIPTPQAPAAADANLTQTLRETVNTLLKATLEQRQGKQPGADTASMEMLQSAHERSMDMLARQTDPAGVVALLGTLKELIGPAQQQTNPVALMKEVVATLRDLMPAPAAATPSPAAQFKEMFETFSMFKEMAGGADAPRAGKTNWADVVMNGMSMLPTVLTQAAAIFYAGSPQRAAANPAAMRAPGAPHQADSAPPALSAPATHPAMPPELANDPAVQQLAHFLPMIGQPLLNYLNQDRSGADFADWIKDSYNASIYGSLQQLKPEQIRAGIELTPGLNEAVRTLPAGQIEQFILEFLNPALADEEEPEPLAAAATTTPLAKPAGRPQ